MNSTSLSCMLKLIVCRLKRFQSTRTEPVIRSSTLHDAPAIFNLYKRVSSAYPENISQQVDELSLPFVKSEITKALLRGLTLTISDNYQLFGFFKAYTSEYRRYAHVLTNATLIIDPDFTNRNYGEQLAQASINRVIQGFPHILIGESLPFQSNYSAMRLYTRMGFVHHTQLPMRIFHTGGKFSAQDVLHYINPNFCQKALLQYHQYLRKLQASTESQNGTNLSDYTLN